MGKNQQQGNIIILALPLVISIAILMGVFISWLDFHMKLQARDRVLEDASHLSTMLKMVFSNRAACKRNLSAAAFGTSRSSLGVSKNLSVLKSSFMGATPEVWFSSGQNYHGLLINDVKFSVARKLPALENSYIADLSILYRNPLTQTDRELTLPFYFITDSTGNTLQDCLATSYIDPHSQITTEDRICMVQHGSGNYIYLPKNQTCALKN
ncbi:MAG TPA: hypothetical protein VIG33_00905 [Pseudobdellovibrionaceae bacterium]|jgi:hypothetical protein